MNETYCERRFKELCAEYAGTAPADTSSRGKLHKELEQAQVQNQELLQYAQVGALMSKLPAGVTVSNDNRTIEGWYVAYSFPGQWNQIIAAERELLPTLQKALEVLNRK